MTPPSALPDDLGGLLAPFLTRQRWYAGPEELDPDTVRVVESRELHRDEACALHLALVDAAGSRYQVLVGERADAEAAEFLQAHGESVIAGRDGRILYDAVVDPELARELLGIVTGGTEEAARVRPVGAEQSNTSLVYDDRIILKVFRRLAAGPNPDVDVTTALAEVGFEHVARPVAAWRSGDFDLAFAQEFLAGGAEGWALALTSLRDFYNSGASEPAATGGDFGMEARRLGAVSAQLHLAMADAFGVERDRLAAGDWAVLLDSVGRRLDAAVAGGLVEAAPAGAAVDRLRTVTDPGPAIRVHGDFHLGQTMRADDGWYVLDFEGEPARPREERLLPTSAAKDVAGMLRSFDYAAHFALADRATAEAEVLAGGARAWAVHNGEAFVAGYEDEDGIERLLPPEADRPLVLAAFELDKALYELDYERTYRPTWVEIPQAALRRITGQLAG